MNKPVNTSFTLKSIYHCKNGVASTFLLFAFCFLLPQKNIAQTIGNWTFNSILSGVPGVNNSVSIADFSTSVPIHSFNGGTEYYGEGGWPAGAINTAMYLEFSLTPNVGTQLDITSIILTIRRSNTGTPAGSGPNNWSLRSSLDGFTNDIASNSMTLNYANYTISPGGAFLNLYSTITFRLYGYNATIGSGGNSRLVVDNITVLGLSSLLAVKPGNLIAAIQNEKVNLSYTIYNTEKDGRYSIERSTDGLHYIILQTVQETTAETEKQYSFTDDISSLSNIEQFFYRVYITGSSGNAVYSSVVNIQHKVSNNQVKTFISKNELHVYGNFPGNDSYKAILYNSNGQTLTSVSFNTVAGYNSFTLPLNKVIPLVCIVRVTNGKEYTLSSLVHQNP